MPLRTPTREGLPLSLQAPRELGEGDPAQFTHSCAPELAPGEMEPSPNAPHTGAIYAGAVEHLVTAETEKPAGVNLAGLKFWSQQTRRKPGSFYAAAND